jgi:hypothetical protein
MRIAGRQSAVDAVSPCSLGPFPQSTLARRRGLAGALRAAMLYATAIQRLVTACVPDDGENRRVLACSELVVSTASEDTALGTSVRAQTAAALGVKNIR